jgi:amidase
LVLSPGLLPPPPARPFRQEVGTDPGRLRVGFLAHNPSGGIHPDCESAARHAARLLESAGHHVDEAHPPILDTASELSGNFLSRWCVNARMALSTNGALIGRELTADDVEPSTALMANIGEQVSGLDLAKALVASARLTRALGQWWADGWDVLVTPTLGGPPPKLGELAYDAGAKIGDLVPFTTHFNVSGQPAISLPLYWNADGLPIGVQLVAAYGREDMLLRVAAQLEEAQPWADRRPAISA